MKERMDKIKERLREEHSKHRSEIANKHQVQMSDEMVNDHDNGNSVIPKDKMSRSKKIESPTFIQKLVAEFLGTYFFIFSGVGAMILNDITGELTHFGVSLTMGVTFVLAIFMFSHLSGAHFNPAITVSFLMKKRINFVTAISYIMIQILAAMTASFSLELMFGERLHAGVTQLIGTGMQTFLLEFLLTFFFIMVVMVATIKEESRGLSVLMIGSMLFFATFFGGPLTGASLNPARSIGPAIVSGVMDGLWIYVIAPIFGAAMATLISSFLTD